MACPGSITLEAAFPNTSSEYSDNGTACHIVAAECLRSDALVPSDWLGDRVRVNDSEEPDRFVLFNDDLCEMTTGYVDEIKVLTKGRELNVEQRVEFSEYVGVPDQFGTIDAYWLVPIEGGWYEIVICDLKTGFKFIGTDSSQLKFYALGVLSRYELSHDVRQVRLMIYQPRHGGMREETITVEELSQFARTAHDAAQRVELAASSIEAGVTPREEWERIYLNPNPNEDECAFCRAMATCPAKIRKMTEVVGAGFDVVAEQGAVVPTDTDQLALAMSVVDELEDFIKAVCAEVERRLLQGIDVAGYGLELGRQGNRRWKDDSQVEMMLRQQFRLKLEDAYDLKLKSPTSIEKLATMKKPTKAHPNPEAPVLTPRRWEKLKALIVRSDAVPSVKPIGQIKVPYNPTQPAADAFGVVIEEPPQPEVL
jgi:hypothetical protein